MQLERWDRTQVTGNTSCCGKVKLNPAAFQLIQFNIDKEKRGDDGDDDGGEITEGVE